jgi:hypothetical protein
MLGSVVLDLAIGMAFLYLLLSLIASVIQEILASVVQSRSANLQRGIRSLLSGDSIEEGITLVDSVYNHGLVRGLYEDPAKDYGKRRQAVLSKLRLVLQRLVGIAPPAPIAGVSDPLLLPAYIPGRTFAMAMIDILNKNKHNGQNPVQNIWNFLAAHHSQFQENRAVEALLAMAVDAADDLGKLQSNLENWYNDAMDRVSGWYKKYTQNLLLIIGLILAVVFNVNSIRVGRTLWFDRDARQGMVNVAGQYLQQHPTLPRPTGSKSEPGLALPGQAPPTVDPPQDVAAYSEQELSQRMQSTVQVFDDVTANYLLPVGWRRSPSEHWASLKAQTRLEAASQVLMALVGWLLTAVALSLGAPFWFDTLNKLMVVRSTIKPEEKSKTEGSKDG